ncbi:hypothetical protein Scani_72270 [Streptomyces caniferus]|uniref:Uncharacterized protein n=1 Tax=Streptomyces caniferus TaxID=285557 RepID=A0A640SHU4_9ACTN|nr:hypothetical protein Scani_72270 [Streptomyces caniferus]
MGQGRREGRAGGLCAGAWVSGGAWAAWCARPDWVVWCGGALRVSCEGGTPTGPCGPQTALVWVTESHGIVT